MSIVLDVCYENKILTLVDHLEEGVSTTGHSWENIHSLVKEERGISPQEKLDFQVEWTEPNQQQESKNTFYAIRAALVIPWGNKKKVTIEQNKSITLEGHAFTKLNEWQILPCRMRSFSSEKEFVKVAGRVRFSVESILHFLPVYLCSLITDFCLEDLNQSLFALGKIYCTDPNYPKSPVEYSFKGVKSIFLGFWLPFLSKRLQIFKLRKQGSFVPVQIHNIEYIYISDEYCMTTELYFGIEHILVFSEEEVEQIPLTALLKIQKQRTDFPINMIYKDFYCVILGKIARYCSFNPSGIQPYFDDDIQLHLL